MKKRGAEGRRFGRKKTGGVGGQPQKTSQRQAFLQNISLNEKLNNAKKENERGALGKEKSVGYTKKRAKKEEGAIVLFRTDVSRETSVFVRLVGGEGVSPLIAKSLQFKAHKGTKNPICHFRLLIKEQRRPQESLPP